MVDEDLRGLRVKSVVRPVEPIVEMKTGAGCRQVVVFCCKSDNCYLISALKC